MFLRQRIISHNSVFKKSYNLSNFLPKIVAFIIHIQPLSSPLLLKNPPNTFAFIPLPAMSLSSRNRSNSKAFCIILPCVAPFCEGMHYHKTGVPWQMNSTFIIVLIYSFLSGNALFNKVFIRMFFRFWIMRYGIGYAIPHFLSRE